MASPAAERIIDRIRGVYWSRKTQIEILEEELAIMGLHTIDPGDVMCMNLKRCHLYEVGVWGHPVREHREWPNVNDAGEYVG
jgi:hypothetical protein